MYMHVRRYAPRSHSQRLNDQQVSILLRICLPVPDIRLYVGISCACANRLYQAVYLGTRLIPISRSSRDVPPTDPQIAAFARYALYMYQTRHAPSAPPAGRTRMRTYCALLVGVVTFLVLLAVLFVLWRCLCFWRTRVLYHSGNRYPSSPKTLRRVGMMMFKAQTDPR